MSVSRHGWNFGEGQGCVIRTVPRRNKVSHAVATEMANARIDTAMLMVWGKADPRVLKE
jgi:hypothetical protein